MLLLGSTPPGRHIEQHDIFFGIGEHIKDVLPQAFEFWPEAGKSLHLDAWREVTLVDGYSVKLQKKKPTTEGQQLFFINLGGYKPDEFEEFHYKMLVAAADKGDAVRTSKHTAFYKHTGFKGATSHIDDKYGVGVDDFFAIEDILPQGLKEKYSIVLSLAKSSAKEDKMHLGYFIPSKVDRWAPPE